MTKTTAALAFDENINAGFTISHNNDKFPFIDKEVSPKKEKIQVSEKVHSNLNALKKLFNNNIFIGLQCFLFTSNRESGPEVKDYVVKFKFKLSPDQENWFGLIKGFFALTKSPKYAVTTAWDDQSIIIETTVDNLVWTTGQLKMIFKWLTAEIGFRERLKELKSLENRYLTERKRILEKGY